VDGTSCSRFSIFPTAAAFAAAYGQAPLYYSNQNQYFLHGLAMADYGSLGKDWLANTLDPTPLFSWLVLGTVRLMPPWVFHLYHALLMGVYAAAMLDLYFAVGGCIGRSSQDGLGSPSHQRWPIFAALFVLVHSAAARWASYALLGGDYPWYLQAGLASQYILGPMLQPSVFGVLLVLALSLFVRGRWILSAICIALAGSMHNTYLLPGAMLTIGMVVAMIQQGLLRDGLLMGGLTLLLVLPTAIHSMLTFEPTTPEAFAAAQDILANFRIPHHARMDYWLDGVAVLQILWMVLGIGLAWRTRLFTVLLVSFSLALLLSLIQAWTQSNLLALLFPWRLSAVLMPLATTIVLARITLSPLLRFSPLSLVSHSLLLFLAGAGLAISFGRFAFQSPSEDVPVMEFVRQTREPGEVYFLPMKLPDRSKKPSGFVHSLSGDFKPPPAKKRDSRLIAADLQQFRLHTGAPIFVDFKAIPYKDVEVIEWRQRLEFVSEVYEQLGEGKVAEALAELRKRGVTHLLQLAADKELSHPELRLIYGGGEDGAYRVYRLVHAAG